MLWKWYFAIVFSFLFIIGGAGMLFELDEQREEISTRAPVNHYVSKTGSTYTSIQDAVDAANQGDTIIVDKGHYYENVTIYKPGITLKGNGSDDCIIYHYYKGTHPTTDFAAVINVTAKWVNVTGFYINASGDCTDGIRLIGPEATDCRVYMNKIKTWDNFTAGINIQFGSRNEVDKNNITTVQSYSAGVNCESGAYNLIRTNDIFILGMRSDGILFSSSVSTNASENLIVTTGYDAVGLVANYSYRSDIHKNHIYTRHTDSFGANIRYCNLWTNFTANYIHTEGSWAKGAFNFYSNYSKILNNDITTESNSADPIRVWRGHNNTVRDNVVDASDSNSYGLYAYYTPYCSITNNDVTTSGFSADGIMLSYCENNEVHSNDVYVTGNGAFGIRLDGITKYNTVHNNTIETMPPATDGIFLATASRNHLNHNDITTHGNNAHGIHAYGTSHNNFFLGNEILTKGDSGDGIWIEESDQNNITNNIINVTKMNAAGIYLDGANRLNTVQGNDITCWGTGGEGIQLYQNADQNVISNNDIYCYSKSGFGIYSWSCDHLTISGNNIEVNETGSHGIYVSSMDNSTITGNDIDMLASSISGIYLFGCDTTKIAHNDIETRNDDGHGIFVSATDKLNVNNNSVDTYGNGAVGLRFYGNSHLNRIKDNVVWTNNIDSLGFYMSSSTYNVVENNTFVTNGGDSNGMDIIISSAYNKLLGNRIETTGDNSKGIYIDDSSDNILKTNNIDTSGDMSQGIFFEGDSHFNTFDSNFVDTTGDTAAGIVAGANVWGCVGKGNDVNTAGSNSMGVIASPGAYVDLWDSTFYSTQIYGVYCNSLGNMRLYNCTFDSAYVLGAGDENIEVYNYLWVQTLHPDSVTPLSEVDIQIWDNADTIYESPGYGGNDAKTDSLGNTSRIIVKDRTYSQGTPSVENDTFVRVKKIGAQTWEEERQVNMSTSHTEVFVSTPIFAPDIPFNLTINRIEGTNSLNISWAKSIGANSYDVYSNRTGIWAPVTNNTQNWTHELNLEDENWYHYMVRAWNTIGMVSDFSTSVGFYLTDITPPMVPKNLTSTNGGDENTVKIGWTPNFDDTRFYQVQWYPPVGGEWEDIGNLTHPEESVILTDARLFNGTLIKLRIRAWDKVGLPSDWSDPIDHTFFDITTPAEPLNLIATPTSEYTITLSWNASLDEDVQFYRVFINDPDGGKGGPYYLQDETNYTTYDLTELSSNTTYFFVVASVDEAGNPSVYSNEATATTFKFYEWPEVKDFLPEDNTTDVKVVANIAIVFNVGMDPDSVRDNLVIEPAASFNFTWKEGNTILELEPVEPLKYFTEYKFTFGTACASLNGKLMKAPFVTMFRTEAEMSDPEYFVRILSPSEGTTFIPLANITVLGTTSGFSTGTEITVTLGSETIKGSVDTGSFSVVIQAPAIDGNHTITVIIGSYSETVVIQVVTPTTPDDDVVDDDVVDDDDDDTQSSNTMLYVIIAIIILVLIAIIVALIVMRRKKPEEEKKAETDERDEEEEVLEPVSATPMSDALEAEVSTSDIFREKTKAEGRKEAEGKKTQDIQLEADPTMDPAGLPQTDIQPWGLDEGPTELLEGDTIDPTADIDIDDPFHSDIPMNEAVHAPLALPPATIFEADFSDMPQIDELFIITQSGLLIQHFSWKETSIVDEDILASMLTVITSFAKDSFGQKEAALKNIGFGDFNLLITPGKYLSVVVISPSEDLKKLEKPVTSMISDIELVQEDVLKDWNGDKDQIPGMEDYVNRLVGGEY